MRNRWALLLIIVLAIAAACIIVSTKYGPLRIQMPRPIAYTMIVRGPTVTNQLAKFVQQVESSTRSTTSQQREQLYRFPGDSILPDRLSTGVEQAERLNLFQMQEYQRRALRTIQSDPVPMVRSVNRSPESLR